MVAERATASERGRYRLEEQSKCPCEARLVRGSSSLWLIRTTTSSCEGTMSVKTSEAARTTSIKRRAQLVRFSRELGDIVLGLPAPTHVDAVFDMLGRSSATGVVAGGAWRRRCGGRLDQFPMLSEIGQMPFGSCNTIFVDCGELDCEPTG